MNMGRTKKDTKPRRVLTLEQILSLQAQEIQVCNQYDDFTIAAADEQSDGLSGKNTSNPENLRSHFLV